MSKQPNLIYIFADQLRRDACGYAGSEYHLTPNIDAMAAESLEMTRMMMHDRIQAHGLHHTAVAASDSDQSAAHGVGHLRRDKAAEAEHKFA